MPQRWITPGLKTRLAFGMIFLFVQPDVSAAAAGAQQIGGVIIPQAFSQALQDGMSVPLYIHLAGSQSTRDDQRIGSAFIWLDGGQLRVRQIQLEESEGNASVSEQTRQQLIGLANAPFSEALTIPLTDSAQLDLSLRQLLLQLVVKREALGTVLRSRSEDIGQSSVNTLSSNLSYNLGVYNNQMRNGGSNTSSYLSLNNVTALREHHVVLDGSLYGIGSGQQDSELYKAMYERDFAGHRFAGGMLDTWNLQSLGPMTAISAGKIYGLSWGNQASSTVFDNSQSATPVIAFLPAAGEVHLTRDGRLLSVQNFAMGNHEVDTRGLPYGIYDVEVEVIVNGRVVSKRTQRVNKLFSRGRGAGAPLAWQVWGGSFHMDRWSESGKKTRPAKESWLAGLSASGSLSTLSWAATGYGYDNQAVGETRLTLPLGESINVNLQNMLASDSSWSSVGSISATLPGGFSSVWVNQERTRIGDQLRRSDADNRAIGGTLNLNALWSKLGTFSVSYNDDRRYNSHYYTADYYQTVYSGAFGSLGLRAGIQRYNNGDSSANTGKYIALDLSLPLGNWFSAGMTHQNGYTMANLSARKQFDEGTIRTIGANLSLASAVGAYDMQFSLNGSSWKPVSNTAYYYTFNEMKSSDSIYVFFSSNFFKQMVNLGISDINTKDLFNFRFQNTTSPESGWYEFSTSNTLIIKPRDFSISIISDEYTSAPSREGYVGSGEPALDFGYIVTTSGKTAADEVLIKVTGPAQVIGGRSYCLFSSDDGTAKVPFPATLSFITRSGTTQTYDAGCDDSWRDMTDALWLTTPWTDISGEVGQMDKTTVKFSIPMDNAISLRTVDDNGWFGEVSASGEIHVQATWRNIN